jgi:hypothetical protein
MIFLSDSAPIAGTTYGGRLDWPVLKKPLAIFGPVLVWLEPPAEGKTPRKGK